jgi:hypothetical protein
LTLPGVWDEQLTPLHTGSNTAGEFLFGAGGGSSPSAIADAVWDEPMSAHTGTADTAGAWLFSGSQGTSAAAIADEVWNTTIVGHTGSNTFGQMVGKKLLKLSFWLALK